MPRRDDDGAYLVLWALLVTAVFAVAALVLDIATLRQDRRTDRLAADLAATAAVSSLDATDPATFATACQAAWGYVRVNLPSDSGPATAPPCTTTFPSTQPCTTAMAARTATATVGDLRVEITHPVPTASTLMRAETPGGDRAQAASPSADGNSCERVAVRLVRSRTFSFGGVVGQPGGGTDVHSVARALTTTAASTIPGIALLDRDGCGVLTITPEGGVLAAAGVGQPGRIVVDSDASTCSSYVIDPEGTSRITAVAAGLVPGEIGSHTLAGGNPGWSHDPGDVASGRISPGPTPLLERFTRAPVDQRYNCTLTCPPGSDHIDQLEAALGGPGVPPPLNGQSFTVWNDCAPTSDVVLAAGNWFVDCPSLDIDNRFTIEGGVVVLAGRVEVKEGPNNCFAVNSSDCASVAPAATDSILYFRSGDLVKLEKGLISLERTFVYLSGSESSGDGRVVMGPDFSGGASRLRWTAPNAGPFEDLMVWTESGAPMALGGQGTMALEGVFFAPNTSQLAIAPRPGQTVSVNGQLIVNRLRMAGDNEFRVTPLANRSIGRLERAVRLIR